MSVHKQGKTWRVRWNQGGKQQSRTFDRKRDADTFNGEMRRRLQLGPTLARELARSPLTLDEFVADGFRTHAATLSPASRRMYAWALEHHLAELVDQPLLELDVPRLAEHQRLMLDRGASPRTVREVLTRLSGILQVAVEHGAMPANPVRGLRKVRLEPRDGVQPLSPVELERLIATLDDRDRAIVLLAGHLGLRPIEVRAVPWNAFTGSTLTVGRSRPSADRRPDPRNRRPRRDSAGAQGVAAQGGTSEQRHVDHRRDDAERDENVGSERVAPDREGGDRRA